MPDQVLQRAPTITWVVPAERTEGREGREKSIHREYLTTLLSILRYQAVVEGWVLVIRAAAEGLEAA